MSLTIHFHWKKTKCLCRFLDSMTKSQSRRSKKDSHMAEGKMPIPKQFQNRNWQAEVRMVCNGEHCLHWRIKKNVCCGIPYGHRSAPVLHPLRGGVTKVMCWHGSNFNFSSHKALPGCHSLGLREEKMGSLVNRWTGQIPAYKPKRSRVQRFHSKMDWEPAS